MLVSQIRDTHLQEDSPAFNGNSGQLFSWSSTAAVSLTTKETPSPL